MLYSVSCGISTDGLCGSYGPPNRITNPPHPMRLGLIQTRGLGDIVIAAPIAQYYIDRGHEVFWPVDHYFYPSVQAAFPEINFIQLDKSLTASGSRDYFLDEPLRKLQALHCKPVISLYSYLSGLPIINEELAASLKFDEYKYAICGVPFSTKWQLEINRNEERETLLYESLSIHEPYIVVHNQGSNVKQRLPIESTSETRIIYIDERTDNPFDWLATIEHALEVHLIDSVFANIVEQLALNKRGYLYLRSQISFTPVFKHLSVRTHV